MQSKGHEFFISARRKECTFELLDRYNFEYYDRGKGSGSLGGKIFYLFKADYLLFQKAKNYNPDIFLSFSSPYAAHVSKLLRKPNIAFNDTEHARFAHFMYSPFSDIICTPACYNKDFGKKQIRFSGYMELCSLHPKYYNPNPEILRLLGIEEQKKYVVLRFVSWKASHDIGKAKLSLEEKRRFIRHISKYAAVYISSEGEVPPDLKKYQIDIPPEKIHDLLAYATLYVGEGATMASECAMLGTPAIYVNILDAGTLQEQEKYGLLFSFRNSKGVLEKAIELLNTSNLKQKFQKRRQKMLSDKIDVTAFMIWFIENYPESVKIMKDHPDYQSRFKSKKTSA